MLKEEHLPFHTLQHITYTYSSICTVRGEAPPVLVHTMSNAGFIAYGGWEAGSL